MAKRKGRPADCPYVGKGGMKLEFALSSMNLDVTGIVAADLGCNIGGFTDCMLQRGARKVYAVDTGYGFFEYKLRIDPRVEVFERTNALHWEPPELVDLATIDLAWTPQRRSLPAAQKIIKPDGKILSLVKPQYEADQKILEKGILPEERIEEVMIALREYVSSDFKIMDEKLSPLKGHKGNTEFWLLLTPK